MSDKKKQLRVCPYFKACVLNSCFWSSVCQVDSQTCLFKK